MADRTNNTVSPGKRPRIPSQLRPKLKKENTRPKPDIQRPSNDPE